MLLCKYLLDINWNSPKILQDSAEVWPRDVPSRQKMHGVCCHSSHPVWNLHVLKFSDPDIFYEYRVWLEVLKFCEIERFSIDSQQ